VLRTRFNHAGALESVELNDDGNGIAYVKHIAYNAKGQRTLILYGNKVMTRYAYDEKAPRLARMRSEKYDERIITTSPSFQPVYRPLGDNSQSSLFQDLSYKYDLVGNILKIHDRTPKSGISNSPIGIDALDRVFTYDPLYRLLSATGRECSYDLVGELPPPWMDKPKCIDPTLTRAYTQEYQYDPVGNIESLKHYIVENTTERGLTRKFTLAQDDENIQKTNRLNTLTVSDKTMYSYAYDKSGNLIKEGSLRHFEWDHSDHMRAFYTRSGDGGSANDYSHYLYDSSGQRVKKLVGTSDKLYQVALYIDGVFEYHRLVRPSNTVENNTIHVTDNRSRIALVRVGDAFPDDGAPEKKVKYHVGDHLGSSNVVIDEDGNFINREEYYPYGETSFGGFARKRYRFTEKERDEESGLYYHGARYYMSWLGRWINCDPSGITDGLNLFVYVQNRPINMFDAEGNEGSWFSELRQAVRESAVGRGILGFSYGAVQALTPGGTTLPSPPGGGEAFDVGKGLGQLVVGTAETFGGGALIVGGAGLAAGGGVLEVGSVGIATPVAVPAAAAGAAAVTVGIAIAAHGATNISQGFNSLIHAMSGNKGNESLNRPQPTSSTQPGASTQKQIGRGSEQSNQEKVTHAPNFDKAREEAFKKAGMTDPKEVKFTKVDPKTGTVVEFKGPGGKKVAYDQPHATPGPGHDKPHIGWQTAGKGPVSKRGNITYEGPQHPYRSPDKNVGKVEPH
jgi:RHS repeat-associated protein